MTLKQFAAGAAAFAVVFVLLLPAAVNSSAVKSFLVRRVAAASGREVRLDGTLSLKLRWPPSIEARGLVFGNPPWAAHENMLELPDSRVVVDLGSIFFGERVELREVALNSPTVVLEKSASGQANWTFEKTDERPGDAPSKDAQEGRGPVFISNLVVDAGTLKYIDPKVKTDVSVKIETATVSGSPAVRVDGTGKYKGLPAKIEGTGGSVLVIHDETRPYPVEVKISIGRTSAALKGTITGLAKFAGADLELDLRGASMADLFPILGITLPPTPAYRLKGRLVRTGKTWAFTGFNGSVGESDLGGDFNVATAGEHPVITASLVSKLLDMKDLGGFVGVEPEATAKSDDERVIPEKEWRLERLRAMDADVRFDGKKVRGIKNPMDDLKFHLKLESGLLTLDPLDFGIAGGDIVSKVRLDAREDRIRSAVDADFRKIRLPELFPGNELLEKGFGIIGGRAKLAGSGNSPAALLASSDGTIGVATSGGIISRLLMEITSLNGGEILRLLFAGDEDVALRCAVSQFRVKNGVLEPEFFVIDTEKTVVTAEGTVDLASEQLDLTLYPEPKSPGILSVRGPIQIKGAFRDPSVIPDPKHLLIRGGIAALLGFASPIASLVAFIEPGGGDDQPCGFLVSQVKTRTGIADSALEAK